jgi:hypothetical protein
MGKYKITRLVETAKLKATDAGDQLSDFIDYMAGLAENVSRLLRNGLTFADNFNCDVKTVTVKHNVVTVIETDKPVTGMLPVRAYTTGQITGFAWYYNAQNQLVVNVSFSTAPADSQKVTLVLLF